MYLLDTNVLIWFLDGSSHLSSSVKEVIENTENDIYVSIACLWEIAIKRSIQKLEFTLSFQEIYRAIAKIQATLLPIYQGHLEELEVLPFHHRDPFDRLIIAQAKSESLTILTKDSVFSSYSVDTIW